jgi:hypothetical protein
MALVGFAVLASACDDDPTREAAIAALGPEAPGVKVGPLHRPGQPCVSCHREGEEAEAYVVAGTVYRDEATRVPLPGVRVLITDAQARTFEARSNCAGNFYLKPREAQVTWPIWVTMRHGAHEIEMESPIYREGSCAACHAEPAGPRSAGPVFMFEPPVPELPVGPCDEGEGRRPR